MIAAIAAARSTCPCRSAAACATSVGQALFDAGVAAGRARYRGAREPGFVAPARGATIVWRSGSTRRDARSRCAAGSKARGAISLDVAAEFADAGVAALVVTQIARDGTLEGPDLEGLAECSTRPPIPVIASGGVGTLDDLRGLAALRSATAALWPVPSSGGPSTRAVHVIDALAASTGRSR